MHQYLFLGSMVVATGLCSMEYNKRQEFEGFKESVAVSYALGGKFEKQYLRDPSFSDQQKKYMALEAVRYDDMANLDVLPDPEDYRKHLESFKYPERTIEKEVQKLEERNSKLLWQWLDEDK